MRYVIAQLALNVAFMVSGSSGQALQTWIATPELTIGSVDQAGFTLENVTSILVDANENVYALDTRAKTVRVYDSNGSFLRTIGRPGNGPGEFQLPVALGRLTDTLWVADAALNRVSFFSLDGGLLSTVRVEYKPDDIRLHSGVAFAMLADGTAIATAAVNPRILDFEPELVSALVRMDRTGRIIDTLGVRRLRKNFLRTRTAGTLAYQPLSDALLWRAAPNGQSVVVVDRAGAPDHKFGIRKLAIGREGGFERRYPYTPRQVSGRLVDSLVQAVLDRIPRSAGQPALEAEIRDGLFVPEFQPPIRELLVDGAGMIWIRTDALDEDRALWEILAANGDPLAKMFLPSELKVLHADSTSILGVIWDSMDVQYIAKYAIVQGRE